MWSTIKLYFHCLLRFHRSATITTRHGTERFCLDCWTIRQKTMRVGTEEETEVKHYPLSPEQRSEIYDVVMSTAAQKVGRMGK